MSSSGSGRSAGGRLLGRTEPRLWTRPLRELTPDTSFGFEAIEWITQSLGRYLYPWQRWFLVHSLELAPGSFTWDESPVLRFETVILLVARQNGKSYVVSSRALWRMFMWEAASGEPPLILGTAHKESAAEEIKDLAVHALKASGDETLRGALDKRNGGRNMRGNGDIYFEVANGSRYRVEAATDDGGRGLTVTDLIFDELRQQRDWSAWSAMTNTTNAVPAAQVLAVSNAGEAKSVVLSSLRNKAVRAIEAGGAPEDPTLGLFEWSAPDGCDIWDRDGWAQGNPSLNHPDELGVVRTPESKIASKAALVGVPGEGMPEHKFRTENLCQWVTVAEEGPFTEEQVEACADAGSRIAEESPLVIAVDTSHDRKRSYIAVAGYRDDGLPHVELIVNRPGTEWVPKTVAGSAPKGNLAFTPDATVVQGRGAPASSLIDYLEQEGVDVTRCEGNDLGASCGQFYDRVLNGTVRFPADDDVLRLAMLEGRQKTLGEVWVWNRKDSPVDVAPLCAVTEALWGLEMLQDSGQVKVTAYGEDYERWW